jgi:serine/threonine protein kinase
MGIANRDIKLENTLLMDLSERPLLKLCDFGYSKDEYQGSACKTLCGKHAAVTPTHSLSQLARLFSSCSSHSCYMLFLKSIVECHVLHCLMATQP